MDSHLLKLKLVGSVQDVGFRYWVYEKARELGVVGFVRNLPDGSVEIVAEGEPHELEKFLELASQGPRSARVDNINIDWQKPTSEFVEFEMI